MKAVLVAAVCLLGLVPATVDAQQYQCANGVCRLVQAPAQVVRAVLPAPRHAAREPAVSITSRYVSFDLGAADISSSTSVTVEPSACSCDPCNCAENAAARQRVVTRSVYVDQRSRYRTVRPFGQVFRPRLRWSVGGGCFSCQ